MIIALLHNFGSDSRNIRTTLPYREVFISLSSVDFACVFLTVVQKILDLRVIEASFWFFSIIYLVLLTLDEVYETVLLINILLFMWLLAYHVFQLFLMQVNIYLYFNLIISYLFF